LNINRTSDWKALGGRASVGVPGEPDTVDPIWTDEQLGLRDGSSPRPLRNGQQCVVDMKAVNVARNRFDLLLGPISGVPEIRRVFDGTFLKVKTGGRSIAPDDAIPRRVAVSA